MNKKLENIGERLRHIIDSRNVSKLMALAAEINVHQSALSRWRNGEPMSMENASKLAVALDVSLDWLVLGRAGPEQHKMDGESTVSGETEHLCSAAARHHLVKFLQQVRAESARDPRIADSANDMRVDHAEPTAAHRDEDSNHAKGSTTQGVPMADATLLSQIFMSSHNQAHADAAALGNAIATPQRLGESFIEIWPKARIILVSLQGFASLIPGVSNAGPVLAGLIDVGDAIQKGVTA